jgi:hypothetical protein
MTTGTERAAEERKEAAAEARADAKADKPIERFVPMRARLVCSEIKHTRRGVTVLTLDVAHDGNIKKEEQLVPGNTPVGTCSIEVNEDWAAKNAPHGAVFYLISTNQKQ